MSGPDGASKEPTASAMHTTTKSIAFARDRRITTGG